MDVFESNACAYIHIHVGRWCHCSVISFIVVIQMHVLVFSGTFYDFHCAPNERAEEGYQYIAPNLTFPCDGVVTKWKIGVENQNQEVYLQIWRPDGTDYSRVAETVYTHSRGETITEVSADMTVSAGDAVGFFAPMPGGDGLRLAWALVPDHTLLQGGMSNNGDTPVATFTDSHIIFSSSPLVSVMFGECIMMWWCVVFCHHACSSVCLDICSFAYSVL